MQATYGGTPVGGMKGGIPTGGNEGGGIPAIGGIAGAPAFALPLIKALCVASNPAKSTSLITPL